MSLPLLAVTSAPPVAAAGPPVAADAGPLLSTLVPEANRFPTGPETQRAVVRDCGFSAPLPNGQALWVFCDTAIYDGITGTAPDLSAQLRFVHSGTGALTVPTTDPTPAAPLELHEAAHPALPARWVTPQTAYGPPGARQPITCATSSTPFAWTKGLVTLPGTSTVVGFVQEHCPEKDAGFPEYDVSITEWDAPAVAAGDLGAAPSLAVSRRYDSVLTNPTPGSGTKWSWGSGPVVHGEHLYTYNPRPALFDCPDEASCTLVRPGSLTIARARWQGREYRLTEAWEYATGSATSPWSPNPDDAADILPDTAWPSGDGLSVAWYPQLGRYVMVHANSRFSPTDGFSLRTATTPWGPWSAPVDVKVDAGSSLANPTGGCSIPTRCRTFAVHPELTGPTGDRAYISYVRNDNLATADGQIVTLAGGATPQLRLASVPLSLLPTAAPDTTLTAFPPDPTAATSASVAFAHETRPTPPGEQEPPAPGITTFRCSLDGATPTPCTSPLALTGLAAGSHTETVAAGSAAGVADPTPATRTWAVDVARPDTTVVAGPSSPATPGASAFTFTGTDDQTPTGQLGYQCALDGGTSEPCAAVWTAAAATTGDRTVAVRAVDRAGNIDPTPATWTWYVDMPPEVTVTSGPAPFTRSTTATVNFTRNDDRTWTINLAPTCSVDDATFAPCTSPVALSGLASGPHSVAVQVTDGSGSTTTATHRWTVDLVAPPAPTVTVPGARSNQSSPAVDLAGTDDHSAPGDLTFDCSLDYAAWRVCPDPAPFGPLTDGYHRLAVRARDQAGNQSEATVVAWTVDTVAPVAVAGSGPAGVTTATTATATATATDDRTAPSAMAWACALDGAPLAPCSSPAVVAGLAPGTHTLELRAVDEAGNHSTPHAWSWTIAYAPVTPLPTATAGVAYQHRLTTNAPPGSVTERWAITAGALPPGLRLWAGEIIGTPTAPGTFGPATLTATSELGTATAEVTIAVTDVDSITGTVRNQVTGAGVPATRVRVVHSSGVVVATVDTDAAGHFRSGYLRPGTYRLSISDPAGGHVTAYSGDRPTLESAIALGVADGVPVVHDVTVVPLTTIAGNVTDATDQTPLVGAWVTLFDAGGASLGLRITDAGGHYAFRSLGAGTYRVSFADMTGVHAREWWVDAVDLATATPIPTAVGGTVVADAALAPVTSVTGVVTDDTTGAPLTGIWVNLYDASGQRVAFRTTDGTGAYAFRFLTPGSYRVSFTDVSGAYAPAASDVAVAGSVTSHITLIPSTALTGRVTDELTGAAVANVWVNVYDAAGTRVVFRTTDGNGAWAARSLPPGAYRVSFTDVSNGHLGEYWHDASTLASATPVTAAGGTMVLDATLAPVARITGRVTNSVTGAAVAGLRVSLVRPDGTGAGMVITSATGTYAFGALPAGSYRVTVGDPTGRWFATSWPAAATLAEATPITVTAGQTAVADVAVDPITTLTGTLTDAITGSPVSGAWATVTTADGTVVTVAASGTDGRYRFAALRPGPYRLRFTDPAARYRTTWWAGADSVATATPVTAAGPAVVANASLAAR